MIHLTGATKSTKWSLNEPQKKLERNGPKTIFLKSILKMLCQSTIVGNNRVVSLFSRICFIGETFSKQTTSHRLAENMLSARNRTSL